MSLYYRQNGKRYKPKYERPGRTKQAFKDSCDINKILEKAQIAGTLSHLEKHGAYYADLYEAPADLLEARARLEAGNQIFMELPAEVRREFENDALSYFAFVNDPANRDRLPEVLPEIAKPGKYFPDVSGRTPPGALLEPRSGSQASPASETTSPAAIEPTPAAEAVPVQPT